LVLDFSQELLLRGAAAGIFLGLAGVIARPLMPVSRWTGCGFSIAAAAHTITQLPNWRDLVGILSPVAWMFSVAAPSFFWAFAVTLFDDRKVPLPVLSLPLFALLVVGALALTHPEMQAIAWTLHSLAAAALFLHAMLLVWRGWRNDMVEARRRLRGGVLVVAGVYGVAIVGVQLWELAQGSADVLSPFAAIALCLLATSGLATFTQPNEELFDPIGGREEPVAGPPIDIAADKLARRLDALMRNERVYRNETLSIGALALQLAVPEYRLRRLINKQLGYRNFSSLLNQWRLEEAKFALRDPAQREVPISTIAFDCGFGSLGPFNRAFKSETGVTPTAYRGNLS
jgi:AraC-like DNA-binding protein